jgi:nucleoside 2-deoxyribosyltransferase
MDYLLDILEKLDIIEEIQTTLDKPPAYILTVNGWSVVQEYLATKEASKQAFIAMWFDPSMQSAREQISKAVVDCGYSEMIIDIKEHNHQIVPEIFYEIKRSCFVIADLTGQRGGVYYEAGYAEALNIPVILCCHKSSSESPHFDVQQKNTIFWEDDAELYNRLVKRITATVGKRVLP